MRKKARSQKEIEKDLKELDELFEMGKQFKQETGITHEEIEKIIKDVGDNIRKYIS